MECDAVTILRFYSRCSRPGSAVRGRVGAFHGTGWALPSISIRQSRVSSFTSIHRLKGRRHTRVSGSGGLWVSGRDEHSWRHAEGSVLSRAVPKGPNGVNGLQLVQQQWAPTISHAALQMKARSKHGMAVSHILSPPLSMSVPSISLDDFQASNQATLAQGGPWVGYIDPAQGETVCEYVSLFISRYFRAYLSFSQVFPRNGSGVTTVIALYRLYFPLKVCHRIKPPSPPIFPCLWTIMGMRQTSTCEGSLRLAAIDSDSGCPWGLAHGRIGHSIAARLSILGSPFRCTSR